MSGEIPIIKCFSESMIFVSNIFIFFFLKSFASRACRRISPQRFRFTWFQELAVVRTIESGNFWKYQLQIAASAVVLPAPLQERISIFREPGVPSSGATASNISVILDHTFNSNVSDANCWRGGNSSLGLGLGLGFVLDLDMGN